MRFSILGSGSKGNALVVEGGGVRVLVDCGLTPKALRGRLYEVGLDLTQLDALVITHGHGDHVRGAGRLAGALGLRTYATPRTLRFCARGGGLMNHVAIDEESAFTIGRLRVQAFSTPHDAPGSVGFVFDDGVARLGVCTDLGCPDPRVAEAVEGCDALLLEFNHDLERLQRGPYPPALKRRVGSERGHLSNDQAATLLAMARTPRLRLLICAHLSEVNNTPALAIAAARSVLAESDVDIDVAPQHAPSRWYAVGRARHGAAPRCVLDEAPQRAAPPASRDAVSLRMKPPRRHAVPASVAVTSQLRLFDPGKEP